MSTRSVMGPMALMIVLGACGGSNAPGPATSPTSATQATAPAADDAPVAANGTPAPDPASFKACEIVTPPEAATIIGGKLLNEPPAGFSNCAYVVEVTGTTESYRINFSTPAMYEALLETQSDAERGEPVAGLWDEAYLQSRAPDNGYTLVVLRRGRLALEVWGDRKEPLVELARLAVSRIP